MEKRNLETKSSKKKIRRRLRKKSNKKNEVKKINDDKIDQLEKINRHEKRVKKDAAYFKTYLSEELVNQGLENKELIKVNLKFYFFLIVFFFKGILRVSQRNHLFSFVDNTADNDFNDYLIIGSRDRNRALNGDLVVIKPKPRSCWVIKTSVFNELEENNLLCKNFKYTKNDFFGVSKENTNQNFINDNNEIDEKLIDEAFIENFDDENLIVDTNLLSVIIFF